MTSVRAAWRRCGMLFGWTLCGVAQGCASYSPHIGASTTPPGENEAALAADVTVLDRGLGPEVFPNPEFSLRRGVGTGWDLGVRLHLVGFELSARRRLLRQSGYELTVVPLMGIAVVTATNADTSFATASLGGVLLGGFELGSGLELGIGLRSQFGLGLNAVAVREDFSAARWHWLNGPSLTLDIPLARGRTLLPGAVLLLPYDLDRDTLDFPVIQAGVAFLW